MSTIREAVEAERAYFEQQISAALRQRDLAEAALTRVETERIAALRERDEARAVARKLLPYCRGREGLLLGVAVHLISQYPCLKEKNTNG